MIKKTFSTRERNIIADIYHSGNTHADMNGLENMGEKIIRKGSKAISHDFLIDLLDFTEECLKDNADCIEFSINLVDGVRIKYDIAFQFIDEANK